MIDSGTHTPGVTPDLFRLPPDTALRFELPDPRLKGMFSDYHALDSVLPIGESSAAHMLPAWPAIRLILAQRPITVTIGATRFDPMPVAGLYGTTSTTQLWTHGGGVTIGASLTPLGWARMFKIPASAFRDRVVPLESMMAPPLVAEMTERLRASDMGADIKAILDNCFLRAVGPPTRDDADIAIVLQLLADETTIDLASAAQRVAIAPERLRRLSHRYFGFPPKTLLMRVRFLRSLLSMLMAQGHNEGPIDYGVIDVGYCDLSHFLRDADRFLGMTPKRFLTLPHEYLRAAVRARLLILGVPLHAFDRPRAPS